MHPRAAERRFMCVMASSETQNFPTQRVEAMAGFRAWLPEASGYAGARNFDLPQHQNVSRLSPCLQRRLVSEEEIIQLTLTAHRISKVEKFVQEICWRTYWKGWLEQHPSVWYAWRDRVENLHQTVPQHALRAACEGNTGIECFDAWSSELIQTGYLHNHARMWFASIWIFTLKLPWELGADYFFRHLLDADAASNTLSWRWVAGLQTPGKHYVARAENIARFTEGRFDPSGQLDESPASLSEFTRPERVELMEYPAWETSSITEPSKTGLWIHPEDLSLEIANPSLRFAGIFGGFSRELANEMGWQDGVVAQHLESLNDGLSRAAFAFGAEAQIANAEDSLPLQLVEWARGLGLKRVVAMRPFVGPWLDCANRIEHHLMLAGIECVWLRRQWDLEIFPLAKRGFFPFWQKISKRLS